MVRAVVLDAEGVERIIDLAAHKSTETYREILGNMGY
jgi:hypothetical protein